MKRLHVHVGVNDLDQSIQFYSTLFAAEPTVIKQDYAKWMLDDPRVNFAISSGEHAAKGIEHLGIQAENANELADAYGRLHLPDTQHAADSQYTPKECVHKTAWAKSGRQRAEVPPVTRNAELEELYKTLGGDSENAVYLSDGAYLSPNGEISDD